MMLNAMLAAGCSQQCFHQFLSTDNKAIFLKGKLGPALNFTGKTWNTALVNLNSTFTTVVGNVYFEPEARSNWHTHPAGQILIITNGVGYHQIKGIQCKLFTRVTL